MKNESFPKRQHYVPQFLLRNFTDAKNEQLYVFDKQEEKEFKTNIINIAAEKGFYNFDFMDVKLSIELSLSQLETKATDLIKVVIKEGSLRQLTDKDKKMLSLFFAIQKNRVTAQRTMISGLNKILENHIIKMGLNPLEVKGFEKMDEKDVKELSIKMVIDAEQQAPYFYNKAWILFQTVDNYPFIISDNPIVMQNQNNFKPYGNLGLGVRGIEIYMPISKTFLLAFSCRTNESMIRELNQKYNSYKNLIPNLDKELGVEPDYYERVLKSIDEGEPFLFKPENVENVNSLQVIFSNRYVYSSDGNFDMVKDMIKKEPALKKPNYIMGN